MSDGEDDWEKQLEDDSELEKQLKEAEEAKKKQKFKDEDAYDSEEERKKQDAERKAAAALGGDPDAKKRVKQGGQKDYDLMFVQRQGGAKPAAASSKIEEIKKSGLSKEAMAQQLQIAADKDITDSLFADLNVNANSLNLEKDYVNFGKKVSAVLYEGQAPYRIP